MCQLGKEDQNKNKFLIKILVLTVKLEHLMACRDYNLAGAYFVFKKIIFFLKEKKCWTRSYLILEWPSQVEYNWTNYAL